MIINRNLLSENITSFKEDIDFSSFDFSNLTTVKGIESCSVEVNASEVDDFTYLDIKIKATVIAVCSYTLEKFEHRINIKDVLTFTDNQDFEDENTILNSNVNIKLDEYIFSMIVSSIPVNIKKPGAKKPTDGKGYRVLSEDEFNKERANKKNSFFDKLEDLDL